MRFIYNDGGRANSGYKGTAGDCVCRAIAIVAQIPYSQVYEALANGTASERRTKRSGNLSGRKTARNGIHVKRDWFKEYMKNLGFRWVPTMRIGSGCTVHLTDGELPMGRLVVAVSKHYTAVIDGVIHDTHDPSKRPCSVFSANTPRHEIPKNAHLMDNGCWAYEPKRCVYGYWIKES